MDSSFGGLLREWRLARRLSQERLADAAEISPRHLSCVETGRAKPSREMVLVLAGALEVPLREQNTLLHSAGFAPIHRETDLDAPEMDHVRRAIDFILARHEPHGAVVVDSAWNVRKANAGAWRMFGALLPRMADHPTLSTNVMRMLLHPQGLRPICVNWEQIIHAVVERAHREALVEGPRSAAAKVLAEVLAYPDVPSKLMRPSPSTVMPLVIPIHLRAGERGEIDVRMFSTITTLGTPADITAQELRIESWFPADDATDAWIRGLGS